MGKLLAFGRRGTYNPANRKKGPLPVCFSRPPFMPGALPGSPVFPSRIGTESSPAECSRCFRSREYVSRKSYFPKVQGAILMKKILLTVVLGIAVVAGAQDAAQPAQGQPAAPQAPVIKDPAEYNAYVGAVQQKDANAKISGLEAFLTQYPNSVMKNQALEILMGTYQQAGNAKKTMDTATKLVTADTCNVRALALLAY